MGTFEAAGAPFDVTAYDGIRFWAYSDFNYQPVLVGFADLDTNIAYGRSACMLVADGGGCGDDFGEQITLTRTWTQYSVRWSDLVQRGFGVQFPALDRQHVFNTTFQVPGGGSTPYPPVRFCVTDIRFIQDRDAGASDQ
jgi:hypothetical protein